MRNWIKHPIPKAQNVGFHYTDYHYVFLKNDNVMTSKILSDSAQYKLPFKFNPTGFKQEMNMSGSKSVIEVSDGYLVGFDHGEFGGGLYWFSKNGSQKYQISDFHVKQFSKAKDKIYAIAGIEHMGSDCHGHTSRSHYLRALL